MSDAKWDRIRSGAKRRALFEIAEELRHDAVDYEAIATKGGDRIAQRARRCLNAYADIKKMITDSILGVNIANVKFTMRIAHIATVLDGIGTGLWSLSK